MRETTAKAKRTAPPIQPTLPTIAERLERGKALRATASRRSQGEWHPPRGRPDPIDVLIESSRGRITDLVPIRYGRMLQSPFAFYRGAASIMALDLGAVPSTGLRVQACGDCHLMNFGGFATPERRTIFDINDFDETLPAPWEWDLKRLVASFVVAGRDRRFSRRDCRAAAANVAAAYRQRMSELAHESTLKAWYASDEYRVDNLNDPDIRRFYRRMLRKERQRDHVAEFEKLAHTIGDRIRIKEDPPLITHLGEADHPDFWQIVAHVLEHYRESLSDDRRVLFDRFRFHDLALKVVGVGSVGTMCGVVLFLAAEGDPLFLQIKEARQSVLEPVAGKSAYANRGQRVVVGQRIMQAASDIFLGWTHGDYGRHYYVRQLRDVKIKPVIEIMRPQNLITYGAMCGSALARTHARSGDAAVLAGYMGNSATFDRAMAAFAVAYADQNERDHAALVDAVRSGRLEARTDA